MVLPPHVLLPPAEKHCRKCGRTKPLASFPFEKARQQYGAPCKACHAVAMQAFRSSPAHAERLREQERVRSAARRAARRLVPVASLPSTAPGQEPAHLAT